MQARRPAGRRGGVRHGRGRRCRHPQPDPLRDARIPSSYFFGQKALGGRDPRPLRLPDRRHAGHARRDPLRRRRAAPASSDIPPTQEPLARYSGVVKVGPDGTANVAFEMPAFNGTARVMAVAWTKDRVGTAERRRDRPRSGRRSPARCRASCPRRPLALLRAARQCRGAGGRLRVDLDVRGPDRWSPADALRTRLRLDAGGRAASPSRSRRPGPASRPSTSTLHRPGPGTRSTRRFRLRDPARARRRSCAAPCGRSSRAASLTLSGDLLADILPGTGAVSVSVSPLRGARRAGRCSRRSTATPTAAPSRPSAARCRCSMSTGSPQEEHLGLDDKADERVRGADRARAGAAGFATARSACGASGRRRSLARRLRHRLPDPGPRARLRRAADRLHPRARPPAQLRRQHHARSRTSGRTIAYAAYVLARNGRPGDGRPALPRRHQAAMPSTRRSPAARSRRRSALLGDRGRAQTAFASRRPEPPGRPGRRGAYRADYGIAPARRRRPPGARRRDRHRRAACCARSPRSWTEERGTPAAPSTQEQAWMVLAAERRRARTPRRCGSPSTGSGSARARSTAPIATRPWSAGR